MTRGVRLDLLPLDHVSNNLLPSHQSVHGLMLVFPVIAVEVKTISESSFITKGVLGQRNISLIPRSRRKVCFGALDLNESANPC